MAHRLCRWGAVLSLVVFFALALSSAVVKSPAVDEGGRLAMGYSFLRTFDLRFQKFHKHPRLAASWFALPLLLDSRVPALSEVPGWDNPRSVFEYVPNFFYRNPDIVRYTLVGRVQALLLGVVLGGLVFRWASEWFGCRAGLLACFLYAFSPNILAHSRLMTGDVAAALGCLATMYVLQRLLRRPGILRAILTGLVLGLALLIKYSAVVLLPAMVALLLLAAWFRNWSWAIWPDLSRRKAVARTLGVICLIFVLAGLVVWAGFGFELRPLKTVDLPFPLPAASSIDDLVRLYQHGQGKPAFLFGHRWGGGRWYYFLATLLVKTPPPSLLLLGVACAAVVLRRRLTAQVPLWLFPATYLPFAMVAGRNIGHRYLLPILVFGFVFVSQIAPVLCDRLRGWWARALGVLLVAWYLGASLWIYPDYLAYFNLFVGGPSQGYKVLVDSNLDWGQDLVQLRRYMEDNGLDEVWLSLFALTDPALYGVRYRKLPDWEVKEIPSDFHYLNPDPGVYVIGATLLQGIYLPNLSTFDWFLRREPSDQIGYSMLVYRVEEEAVTSTWVGMCYAPDPVLTPDEIVAGFGRADLRVVYFDCRSSLVIPGEDAPGWIVIPTLAQGERTFVQEWLKGASVEFEQRNFDGGRDFVVYRVDGVPDTWLATRSPVWVAARGVHPIQGREASDPLLPPVALDGPATFLGYKLAARTLHPGGSLILQTVWEGRHPVTEAMPSVFVHLVGGAGDAWGTGDALDFPAIQWQDGDTFVQQHTIELPLGIPPGDYWIAAGLYDSITGVRYPVRAAGGGADTVWFGPLAVE